MLEKKNEKNVKGFRQKKETSEITSLRENGILKTDTVDKANICNKQFQSAFTRETDFEIPPRHTKELAYKTLVRPQPYAAPIWHPCNETETKQRGESAEDSSQVDLQAMAEQV